MKSVDKLYRVRKVCNSSDEKYASFEEVLNEFNDYDEATEFMEAEVNYDAQLILRDEGIMPTVEFKNETEAIIKTVGYEARYIVEPIFVA